MTLQFSRMAYPKGVESKSLKSFTFPTCAKKVCGLSDEKRNISLTPFLLWLMFLCMHWNVDSHGTWMCDTTSIVWWSLATVRPHGPFWKNPVCNLNKHERKRRYMHTQRHQLLSSSFSLNTLFVSLSQFDFSFKFMILASHSHKTRIIEVKLIIVPHVTVCKCLIPTGHMHQVESWFGLDWDLTWWIVWNRCVVKSACHCEKRDLYN